MQDLVAPIATQLEAGDLAEAFKAVEDLQPVDQAEVLGLLDPTIGWPLLERLPERAVAFGDLEAAEQVAYAEKLPRHTLASLVSEMRSNERADLYNSFVETQRDLLLPGIEKAKREDMRRLSSYAEGCAGALMSSDYALLDAEMNTIAAINALRRAAPSAETIYSNYVVDGDHRLIGVVSLRELIRAPDNKRIGELMNTHIITAQVDEDQEEVVRLIERYDLMTLPILNADGQLVGIVTHDDAFDVMVEEATDDIYKGAGLTSEVGGTLKDATIGLLYRKRIVWLLLLVFGNLFSGAAIGAFEDVIAANLVLVFFLPLLVDSGGNAGGQSATLMVRALATGEVQMRDWVRLLGREVLVALAIGATLAVAVSILGVIRGGTQVAVVLSLTMVSIVVIGCTIGMSLPFVLSKLKLDPASASAPLVTSICDATGVFIYLFIASQIMGIG